MDMDITCIVLWMFRIKSLSSWESLEELIFQMVMYESFFIYFRNLLSWQYSDICTDCAYAADYHKGNKELLDWAKLGHSCLSQSYY